MKRRSRALIAAASLMCALGIGLGVWAATRTNVEAADHLDPPARVNPMNDPPGTDRAADIGDVYTWHYTDGDGNQKLVLAMVYAGPNPAAADQAGTYDADVLYTFHIDENEDGTAEHRIHARFGQSASGNWGVQLEGVPGADAAQIAGPVEYVNRIPGITDGFFYAGLREDPFFFDLQGFRETTAMGTLRFDNTRDFFAGQNSSVIVLELDADDFTPGADDSINVWGTTGRDNT